MKNIIGIAFAFALSACGIGSNVELQTGDYEVDLIFVSGECPEFESALYEADLHGSWHIEEKFSGCYEFSNGYYDSSACPEENYIIFKYTATGETASCELKGDWRVKIFNSSYGPKIYGDAYVVTDNDCGDEKNIVCSYHYEIEGELQ